MDDLISVVTNYFPQTAKILTSIAFVVFLLLNISDDFDKISKLVKKIFDFRKHMDTLIYANLRKKYNKKLYDKAFLEWQMQIMKKIYGPLIEDKNNLLNQQFEGQKYVPNISFSSVGFSNGDKKEYESITIHMAPVDFPFQGVCLKDKDHFERKRKIGEEKYPGIQNKHKRFVKQYYRLISQTIRYPNRLGYMLDDFEFESKDNQVNWCLKSYVGNYENNLKTSHILEYELYKLYENNIRYNWNIEGKSRDEILKKLPIRKYIHSGFDKECDVLTSGKFRSSLLGVQIFVLIKNYSGDYDALRIRRSTNVVAKPGFLQFIPSGGFEAMNDCVDYDAQWDNYSITKAVFRELLEECFGQDEDDEKAAGNNASPERIYFNDKIKNLIEKIKDDKDGTRMQLLGSTMSLVGLRHELSFILVVEDKELAGLLIGNYESRNAIHMVGIKNLEDRSFWIDEDLDKLNCTSAGLFELARESEIYKEILSK